MYKKGLDAFGFPSRKPHRGMIFEKGGHTICIECPAIELLLYRLFLRRWSKDPGILLSK
jgi:hypothetical protein